MVNRSFDRKPLRIRGQRYDRGLGMRAPANARFALKPVWRRFVALAGVDDWLLDTDHGAMLAKYPSVVFRVFIDGICAAQSPPMRISQAPWRFDVRIPKGSRQIDLVAADNGKRHLLTLGDRVNAGFVS